MKIIQEGILPGDIEYKQTCYNCKTIFTFLGKEARIRYDPRDHNYLAIDCPLCNNICTHVIKSS